MGVYTGSGPTDPVVGNKVSVTNYGVPTADAVQALTSAWTSYTPTITGFTAGNGTATGSYTQTGKLVWFRAQFTFGTTSAAASSACIFTLPVTSVSYPAAPILLTAGFIDSGTAAYMALPRFESTTTVGAYIIGASGVRTVPSTTTPFTWTTSDSVHIAGFYEAA